MDSSRNSHSRSTGAARGGGGSRGGRGSGRGGRRVLAAVGGLLLASLALATPAGAAAAGPACTPGIKVLGSLPGPDPAEPSPWIEDTQVNGIGRRGLSVGTSHGMPTYSTLSWHATASTKNDPNTLRGSQGKPRMRPA